MALVEVVAGLATAPAVAEALYETAKAWGKSPVYAKSTPGFIVNRVARPFYAEAQRVLQEGGADVATIDACCKEAGGFRMGPFELMDLIGHDVNLAVTKTVWAAYYHDPRFLPSLIQQELVAAGFLGRKSGRGFYDHRPQAATPSPDTAPDSRGSLVGAGTITIFGKSAAAEALRHRLTAVGQAYVSADTAQATKADDRIAQVGEAVMFVTDGRTATQRAHESGENNTVLIDLALDYVTASRLAVACAAGCSAAARLQAIGLLQVAGLAVSVFQDIPGLIVMRTVAMLANEAADAVNQGVCTVEAADTAMRLGVNYPRGPLAWADAIGLPRVRMVLAHLGQAHGEDRYRISPLIHHRVFAKKALYD
jgi:3-hydroxybutyryl-CoA dehydrogenase